MKTVVGRLSTEGWAKTNREKMTQVLKNYDTCAFSQSTIYAGHIRSWAYAQQRGVSDPDTMVELVKSDLTILYSDVFSNGEVSVDVQAIFNDENDAVYSLEIAVNVRIGEESIDLCDALKTNKGQI